VPASPFYPGGVIGFPTFLLRCSPRQESRQWNNQDSETDHCFFFADRVPLPSVNRASGRAGAAAPDCSILPPSITIASP